MEEQDEEVISVIEKKDFGTQILEGSSIIGETFHDEEGSELLFEVGSKEHNHSVPPCVGNQIDDCFYRSNASNRVYNRIAVSRIGVGKQFPPGKKAGRSEGSGGRGSMPPSGSRPLKEYLSDIL